MCTRNVINAPADARRVVKGAQGTSVLAMKTSSTPRGTCEQTSPTLRFNSKCPFYFTTRMNLIIKIGFNNVD